MRPRTLAVRCAAVVAVLARWRQAPWPAPGEAPALDLVALHDPGLYWALWAWGWLWPAAAVMIAGSFALALWEVWGPNSEDGGARGKLPPWPLTGDEPEPAVVIGEEHHPVDPVEVARPRWLTVPAQGLFTGTAVFGATGSGKTAACMRPFVAQLLGWQAENPDLRASGLVLEVKGDFCHQVRRILAEAGRESDYAELGIGGKWQWNPLDIPEMDSFSLAYQIASLQNQLYGRGKEPFWQQASSNLLRNLIELHRVTPPGWVTLRDLYRCAIDPGLMAVRVADAQAAVRDDPPPMLRIAAADLAANALRLKDLGPWSREEGRVLAPGTRGLLDALEELDVDFERVEQHRPEPAPDADGRLEAAERWIAKDWQNLDAKLRTSIVEGISSFLSVFDQPDVARVFCPPAPAAQAPPASGATTHSGEISGLMKPLPRLRDLIESGTVLCLNMPAGASSALARAAGVMLKAAWLNAALRRPADMAKDPDKAWRPAVFVCDEYQAFCTVGEDEPAGDEKAFALTRQSRVIPLVASQSISSLKSATRGEAWKTLLQSFRTRIFLTSADADTSRAASEMCGTVERLKPSYNFSENAARAGVSLLSGKAGGARSSVGAGRSYQTRREARFHAADFDALRTCQAIVLPFDGYNVMSPRRVYLKPYFLPRDLGYFEAVRKGRLGHAGG